MASSVRADSVAEAIREVSAEVIIPRFRAWDPVTSWRRIRATWSLLPINSRQALTSRLLDLDPGSAVVGEKAVAANPHNS